MKVMNTIHSTIVQKNDMQPGTAAYQAPEVLVNLLTTKHLKFEYVLYVC